MGEDGPGNTTATSGGGGESASQYSGGFGGVGNDAVDQTWRNQSGESASQYSSPAPSSTVNRSPRYQSESQE